MFPGTSSLNRPLNTSVFLSKYVRNMFFGITERILIFSKVFDLLFTVGRRSSRNQSNATSIPGYSLIMGRSLGESPVRPSIRWWTLLHESNGSNFSKSTRQVGYLIRRFFGSVPILVYPETDIWNILLRSTFFLLWTGNEKPLCLDIRFSGDLLSGLKWSLSSETVFHFGVYRVHGDMKQLTHPAFTRRFLSRWWIVKEPFPKPRSQTFVNCSSKGL